MSKAVNFKVKYEDGTVSVVPDFEPGTKIYNNDFVGWYCDPGTIIKKIKIKFKKPAPFDNSVININDPLVGDGDFVKDENPNQTGEPNRYKYDVVVGIDSSSALAKGMCPLLLKDPELLIEPEG